VRKWLRRHQDGEPLTDRSRRPKGSPGKTDPETEEKVIKERIRERVLAEAVLL
jgi:hypothetical protein